MNKAAEDNSDCFDKTTKAISDRVYETARAVSKRFDETAKAVSDRFDKTPEETCGGSDKTLKKILAVGSAALWILWNCKGCNCVIVLLVRLSGSAREPSL